ncbi:hypothetical protein [Amycolatopsis marina]|nr:hypothetical protein [Amycolatopsis marina]
MSETDWIAFGSIAGAVTAVATALMAVAVIITAFIAGHTLKATREDSRAKTRPIMVAELRRELLSEGTTLIVLKNLGASIAKNVNVGIEPPPPDDLDELPDDNMMKWIYERYATPITTWAPGWTLSNVIRAGYDTLRPITVTVVYEGPDGTQYEDMYYLHPDHILKETESNPSQTTELVKLEQQKIKTLRALVRTIRSN